MRRLLAAGALVPLALAGCSSGPAADEAAAESSRSAHPGFQKPDPDAESEAAEDSTEATDDAEAETASAICGTAEFAVPVTLYATSPETDCESAAVALAAFADGQSVTQDYGDSNESAAGWTCTYGSDDDIMRLGILEVCMPDDGGAPAVMRETAADLPDAYHVLPWNYVVDDIENDNGFSVGDYDCMVFEDSVVCDGELPANAPEVANPLGPDSGPARTVGASKENGSGFDSGHDAPVANALVNGEFPELEPGHALIVGDSVCTVDSESVIECTAGQAGFTLGPDSVEAH